MGSLKTLGEFGLIKRLRQKIRHGRYVRLGIGDDAAILNANYRKDLLFTTDMLIEGRHFLLNEATAFEIGWKAMAVNVSDIAAMGGLPKAAVIAAGLKRGLKVSFVDGLYDGLSAAAKRFGVQIVGGDTNQSDRLVLSVALLGDAAKGKAVRRSGARKGDVVFVTGSLGGSYLSKRHLRFEPRIKESQFLARNFNLHSMIDLSDGLASDITRIAEESGVGARISREAIPVSKGVSVKSAISEGEDFELLFTLSAREAARLALHPKVRGLAPFHRIGRIVDKREGIRLVHANGRLEPLLASGFDHFSRHR